MCIHISCFNRRLQTRAHILFQEDIIGVCTYILFEHDTKDFSSVHIFCLNRIFKAAAHILFEQDHI